MERTSDVAIVPAGPSDAAALAHVHVKAWRETYRGLLPQPFLDHMSVETHARRFGEHLEHPRENHLVLAAEGRRGLVGYCEGRAWRSPFGGGEAEIHTLYLLKAVQGEGLGRRLLQDAARALAGWGARGLIIWVLAENRRACGFYERMGGHAAARRRGPGPGGRVNEVAYGWPDLDRLLAA